VLEDACAIISNHKLASPHTRTTPQSNDLRSIHKDWLILPIWALLESLQDLLLTNFRQYGRNVIVQVQLASLNTLHSSDRAHEFRARCQPHSSIQRHGIRLGGVLQTPKAKRFLIPKVAYEVLDISS
jgi:hypothetical protein